MPSTIPAFWQNEDKCQSTMHSLCSFKMNYSTSTSKRLWSTVLWSKLQLTQNISWLHFGQLHSDLLRAWPGARPSFHTTNVGTEADTNRTATKWHHTFTHSREIRYACLSILPWLCCLLWQPFCLLPEGIMVIPLFKWNLWNYANLGREVAPPQGSCLRLRLRACRGWTLWMRRSWRGSVWASPAHYFFQLHSSHAPFLKTGPKHVITLYTLQNALWLNRNWIIFAMGSVCTELSV